MFDWLGDILSGLGDALSVVFEGVGADIAVDIWNALVEWIYNTVFDAVADLFTSMNNMGAEIFSLSWVNAVVRLFTLFGWALFTVGVVGAVFEVAIESQSGRVSIKGAALNVLKGFFACALIGVLPVELYKFCVSLQNSFAGDLTRIFSSAQGTTIGEIAVFILRAVFRLGTPSEPVPADPDRGGVAVYVQRTPRVYGWLQPVVQAGHGNLPDGLFADHAAVPWNADLAGQYADGAWNYVNRQ